MSTNTNNQSRKVNIRFEHELVEQINTSKDPLIPFSAWVKAACREKLLNSCQVVDNTPPTVSEQVQESKPDTITPIISEPLTEADNKPLIAKDDSHDNKPLIHDVEQITKLIIQLRTTSDKLNQKEIGEELNKTNYCTATRKEWTKNSVRAFIKKYNIPY